MAILQMRQEVMLRELVREAREKGSSHLHALGVHVREFPEEVGRAVILAGPAATKPYRVGWNGARRVVPKPKA